MAHGIHVGRKRVERLMREAKISGMVRRKRGRTTISVPGVRVADDLVERQFRPAGPNQLWVADVTYLQTWEGWLYLAAVQDAYSRAIVGWSMAEHMRAELVVDALQMAVARRRPEPGLIHHSDQGSQYVSLAFGQAAREAGIARSMGSKGDCLRQRRRRELLRHAQEGTRPPPLLADPPRAHQRGLRVHRSASTTASAGTPRSGCSRRWSSRTALSTTTDPASPLRGSGSHNQIINPRHPKAQPCPAKRGNSTRAHAAAPAGSDSCRRAVARPLAAAQAVCLTRVLLRRSIRQSDAWS